MKPTQLLLLFVAACSWSRADTPPANLLSKADHGDAAACIEVVGYYADRGQGVPNYNEAVRYAEKALSLDSKSATAQALLGLFYYQGRGVERDKAKGRALIEASAQAGDAMGKELLSVLETKGHLNGLLPLRKPDADLLARAENGQADAQLELANAYANGWIESPSGQNPAREWRERAAESGAAEAQLFLAEGYLQGAFGYPKDIERGMLWLDRAADQGNPKAMVRAGEIYSAGELVVKEDKRAVTYLQRALDAGAREAETPLGILLIEQRGGSADPSHGLQLLSQAEQRGDIDARRYLFRAVLTGRVNLTDDALIRRLLEQGVRDGNIAAKGYLGLRLYTGQGMPQDIERAAPLLQEAMDNGNFMATQAYVDYLANRIKRLSQATGSSALAAAQHQEAANQYPLYQQALLKYGRNGKTDDRLVAVRELTKFVGPENEEMRTHLASTMDSTLIGALALIRIYRTEGGRDRTALNWLTAMENYLREKNSKNLSGQTALQLIDQRQREYQSFIANHRE